MLTSSLYILYYRCNRRGNGDLAATEPVDVNSHHQLPERCSRPPIRMSCTPRYFAELATPSAGHRSSACWRTAITWATGLLNVLAHTTTRTSKRRSDGVLRCSASSAVRWRSTRAARRSGDRAAGGGGGRRCGVVLERMRTSLPGWASVPDDPSSYAEAAGFRARRDRFDFCGAESIATRHCGWVARSCNWGPAST